MERATLVRRRRLTLVKKLVTSMYHGVVVKFHQYRVYYEARLHGRAVQTFTTQAGAARAVAPVTGSRSEGTDIGENYSVLELPGPAGFLCSQRGV
jgi:hypothetical protein